MGRPTGAVTGVPRPLRYRSRSGKPRAAHLGVSHRGRFDGSVSLV